MENRIGRYCREVGGGTKGWWRIGTITLYIKLGLKLYN